MPRFIVVDDDQLWWERVREELDRSFNEIEWTWIKTESEFRNAVPELIDNPPALILMDVMLPWCTPSEDMEEPPDDVREEGFYFAGLRCSRLLRNNAATKDIPVVLWTVLEREALRDSVDFDYNGPYVRKDADFEPLLEAICQLTGLRRHDASIL